MVDTMPMAWREMCDVRQLRQVQWLVEMLMDMSDYAIHARAVVNPTSSLAHGVSATDKFVRSHIELG
jgi:hypothetical protein